MSIERFESGHNEISIRQLSDLNINRSLKLQMLLLLPRKFRVITAEFQSKEQAVAHLHTILDHLKPHLIDLTSRDVIELLKFPCVPKIRKEYDDERISPIEVKTFELNVLGFIKKLNRKVSLALPQTAMIIKIDSKPIPKMYVRINPDDVDIIQNAVTTTNPEHLIICSRDIDHANQLLQKLPDTLRYKATVVPLELIFKV